MNAWDFEKDTVMSNMMLEAKWTEIHPILEFQEYNGEYEIVGVKDKSAISIEIPSTFNGKSVSVISVHAFKDCKMLSYITIPSSIEIIGDYAFEGCTSLKSLVIPNSVMRMKQTALYQCTALEKLTIGAGVAEPLDFSTLSSLSVIIVDENNTIYTMVENDLYSKDESELIVCLSAKNVTSFIVPENVTKINSQAFEHCQSLENIMISKNVVDIGYLALSVSSVNSIVVDENNVAYKSISGNLYSKDGGTLLTYARGNINTSFEIPQDVTKIQSYAFYGCDNLESLTIPSTVCEIPTNTILACNNLKTVKFSSGVVKVSTRSISNCASLEKIIIPKTVTHIDNYAFWECEKAVIYCEAHSKGDYWLNDWNYNKNTIIWSNAQ